MTEKEMKQRIEKVVSILDDIDFEFTSVLETEKCAVHEAEELRDALDMARCYYVESQKELTLLMKVCIANGIHISLSGHYVGLNDAAPDDDPEKGHYEEPFEWLDSFVDYP